MASPSPSSPPLTPSPSPPSSPSPTPSRPKISVQIIDQPTQVALNTPIARKTDGKGCDDKHAPQVHRNYAEDARKFFVGPMPTKQFYEDFLPNNPSGMPSCENAFDKVPSRETVEKKIYDPLVECLNRAADGSSRCPGFSFHVTATRPQKGSQKLLCVKPDACMYVDGDHEKTKADDDLVRTHLGLAQVVVEVKTIERTDFLADLPEGVDRDAHNFVLNIDNDKQKSKAEMDLGQNVHYAAEVLARQYRTCFFSISLFDTKARIIRWDRAGAVVTEAFDIKSHPEYLCEFLWRYAHAEEYQRGYDPTATPATDEEEKVFEEVVSRHVRLQLDFPVDSLDKAGRKTLEEAVAEHYEPGKVFRVAVFDQEGESLGSVHEYLVSRPVVTPWTVAGRATRGYWAVSAETHKIAFLKDTWRYNVKGMEREGDISQQLRSKGVTNIPVVLHHGDVPTFIPDDKGSGKAEKLDYQHTMSEKYVNADWACMEQRKVRVSVVSHIHYRIVFDVVGYPLKRLGGTHELLTATYNAFEAMNDAYIKAKMLHRDVSVGNILLVRDEVGGKRRGVLIDWELACPIDRRDEHRKYERTGTWQFMSVRLFKQDEGFVHDITDDMESMIYVVLYCGLLYLPHHMDTDELSEIMHDFFDAGSVKRDGRLKGGSDKLDNQNSRATTKTIVFECQLFQEWLTTVMNYNAPLERDKTKYEGKWNPAALLDFWKTFLDSHELPQNDRHEHEIRNQPKRTPLHATESCSSSGRVQAPTDGSEGLRRSSRLAEKEQARAV